jgi:hypothetical protein
MLLLSKGDVGICNHIGISKLCCLVSHAFITEFCAARHIKFTTSGTHDKMYEWSGLTADFRETTAVSGGYDGGGGEALSMERALREFDGTRLRHIFSETHRRVAQVFRDRCQKKYGPDKISTVVGSDSDTSIDGAASPSVNSSYEGDEAYTLHLIETTEEPGK